MSVTVFPAGTARKEVNPSPMRTPSRLSAACVDTSIGDVTRLAHLDPAVALVSHDGADAIAAQILPFLT